MTVHEHKKGQVIKASLRIASKFPFTGLFVLELRTLLRKNPDQRRRKNARDLVYLTFDGQGCAAAGVPNTVMGFTDVVPTVLRAGFIDGEHCHRVHKGHVVLPALMKFTVISEP